MNDYQNEDIAIIGMACLFPGAENVTEYWHNITSKSSSVTDPPPDWQPELFLDETGADRDRVYVGKGGYLGELSRFDAPKYGIMPASIEGSEPDQFLALRCAFEALEDANLFGMDIPRATTGVVLGRGTFVNRGYVTSLHHGFVIGQVLSVLEQVCPDLTEAERESIRSDLKGNIPPLCADTVPGLCHSVLVGRIANRMDLKGPAHTVDAACASSLLAVDAAMRELRSGRCDAMLAGGVQVSTPAVIDLMFCHLEALSHRGRIAPFAADADGTLLGEGCGVVVLKRRSDAERDGNRIYALLKGVGVSSDGRQGGLLAPQSDGQVIAIRQAYETTGIDPSSVGLIEAHGTGIPLGDRTEIRSLREVFGERNGGGAAIALGSVKSMISHLIPAAGVASIIKTALALHHRVLPPMLHAETPDPELGLDQSPFYLSSELRPWIRPASWGPRRAGVDAFGFGGINAHLVMEELPDDASVAETHSEDLDREWPVELVVLSAANREQLGERARARAEWLEAAPGANLVDVAAACASESGPSRVAICAKDTVDLVKKLKHVAKKLAEPDRVKIQDRSGIFYYDEPLAATGRVAFLFPGEGAQYVGMLSDLCAHFPCVRREFEVTDEAFARAGLGQSMSGVVYPVPEEREIAEESLFVMQTAVEAVTTANRALMALTKHLGIRPDGILGHSSGEFAALVAAGAVDIDNREELIRTIVDGVECTTRLNVANLVPEAVLTTVGGAGVDAVERVVADSGGAIAIAIDNCPHQMVIAGNPESMRVAVDQLQRQGGMCEQLAWNRAYHTEEFGPACDALEDYFATLRFQSPQVELWSCASKAPYPTDPAEMRALAVRQWQTPVRFRETVGNMYSEGYRVFVDVGPKGSPSAFVSDTLSGKPHASIALDVASKPGLVQLCRALGQLVAHGVSVDLEALFRRRRPKPVDFDAPAPGEIPKAPVLRLDLPELKLSRELAERLRAGRSRTSTQPSAVAKTPKGADPTAVSTAHHEDAFADFQDTMRAFLSTQESAMRAFLGSAAPTSEAVAAAPPSVPTRADAVEDALPEASEVTRQRQSEPPETPSADSASDSVKTDSLEELLNRVISDRTGYPPEILEADSDLEAELGIDSIKRVEIIATFRRLAVADVSEPPTWFMEQMTEARTARDIVRGVEALRSGAGGSVELSTAKRFPLLREIRSITPGVRVEAACELSCESDAFLMDHAFGNLVSTEDSALKPLAVMPLAMTMELMAEAAALLGEDKRVIRMLNVESLGWLPFDRPTRRLEVEATRTGDAVEATVFEADRSDRPALARARVELAERWPALGLATVSSGKGLQKSRWTHEALYREGMFHGPSFRSVSEIEGWSEGAVRARLERPQAPLLSVEDDQAMVLPVALLDGVGQVLGFWRAEKSLAMCFPIGLDRLELGADPGRLSSALEMRAEVSPERGTDWRSEAEVLSEDGGVVVRLSGRRDRDVGLPEHFWRYRVNPRQIAFSRPLGSLFDGVPGIEHCHLVAVDEFAGSFLVESDGLWALDLAHYVLSRRERELYARLTMEPLRRVEWLLARVALKDAARLEIGDESLCMADLEVEESEGVLQLASKRTPNTVASVATREYLAVAVVGDSRAIRSVGVAIGGADDEKALLSSAEQALVQRAGAMSDEARRDCTASMSCAKRAVASANARTSIESLEIVDVDRDTGAYEVAVAGDGGQTAFCRNLDGHPVALAVVKKRPGGKQDVSPHAPSSS